MVSIDTGPLYDLAVTEGVHFRARVGFKTANFSDGSFDEDPSISQEVARGAYPLPPGFVEGYTSVYEQADVSFDSREPRPAPGSGVRVSGHVNHGTDLRANPGGSWVRFGGTAGAFLDITGQARTLGLVVNTEFVESVHGGPTPFTEQVMLGGSGAMSGFRAGRLVGQSAVTAALVYRWPIWVWLDGALLFAAGNVFDAGLRGFDPKLLRLSSGIGIRSNGSPDHQIELDIGIGTETFEQGTEVTSFRLAVGGTNGF
jgi:outer membrane protein assembly factor BamA